MNKYLNQIIKLLNVLDKEYKLVHWESGEGIYLYFDEIRIHIPNDSELLISFEKNPDFKEPSEEEDNHVL